MADWLSDVLAGVDLQVQNANNQAYQIQKNVNEQISRSNHNINAQIVRINQDVSANVAKARENAAEVIKNAQTGSVSSSFSSSNGGQVFVSHGSSWHTVNSGKDSLGRPYYREVDERVKDGILYHTERIYNNTSGDIDTYAYARKLSDHNDQFIYNNFTSKNF